MSETDFPASPMCWWLHVRATPQLRWVRGPNTTTEPDRLQQLWEYESDSGVKHEWQDVRLEIVSPTPPTKET